jgi:glycosyltransferase involved in cell wall biosynthesis
MACALPAIGTDVGGAELLHQDDIVPRLNDELLADKLYEVITNPKRLTEMSRRNLHNAKSYSAEILSAQKIDFYAQIKSFVANEKNY